MFLLRDELAMLSGECKVTIVQEFPIGVINKWKGKVKFLLERMPRTLLYCEDYEIIVKYKEKGTTRKIIIN